MISQGTPNYENNLEKEEPSGGLTLPDLKTYYKSTAIKAVQYWYKDRHIYQWNRMKNLEIDSRINGQMIFRKGAKTIQWEGQSF